jgi:hypothetical protein
MIPQCDRGKLSDSHQVWVERYTEAIRATVRQPSGTRQTIHRSDKCEPSCSHWAHEESYTKAIQASYRVATGHTVIDPPNQSGEHWKEGKSLLQALIAVMDLICVCTGYLSVVAYTDVH